MTSTSNNTNKIAAKKYLIAIGWRALPTLSIPLSKFWSFSAVFLLGPKRWVTPRTNTTKPSAKMNWTPIGK